jgi:carbonic anhydrase
MDPEQILQQLMAGNRRYALGAGIHPNQTLHRRDEILDEPRPFATIIGCSDSRVPPEIVFDCGLGDLFVIRLGGNMVTDSVLASAQFSVEYQGVEVILLLGHSDCGAVKSAMQGIQTSGPLKTLLAGIQPAVAMASGRVGDPMENAVIQNIRLNLMLLKESHWARKILVRGAYYNMKSGLVALDPEI